MIDDDDDDYASLCVPEFQLAWEKTNDGSSEDFAAAVLFELGLISCGKESNSLCNYSVKMHLNCHAWKLCLFCSVCFG